MIQGYYRQMRKFRCNILAAIQQYDIIKESAVRGAMIGNSRMLSTVAFRYPHRLIDGRLRIFPVPNIGIALGKKTALIVNCGVGRQCGQRVIKAAEKTAPERAIHPHPDPHSP